jgi:tRNA (Thr-GGU) A37 N-methylase
MVLVREVASVVRESSDSLVLELCKPQNAEAFLGMLEWSHCWVVVWNAIETKFEMEACEIVSTKNREIELRKVRSFSLTGVIIDIKPVHSLDLHIS